jgi:hypothetical protein
VVPFSTDPILSNIQTARVGNRSNSSAIAGRGVLFTSNYGAGRHIWCVPPAALPRPGRPDRLFRGGHVSSRGHQAGREVTTYRVKARARVWTGIRMKHRLSLTGKSHRGNALDTAGIAGITGIAGEKRKRREGRDPRPRFDRYSTVLAAAAPLPVSSPSSYDIGTKEFRTCIHRHRSL